ncbi:MAG: hypothetical protein EZS28_027381 [Streblomastix strix]|uniref:Uncharacterized protein n=1 Tax=Streblomastix strix TaxID=222440 RepID=A0A5J4V4R5_9EUKA|nr:MAG: hypothetical protein EZS28_027381 [Streblomastix strix]
MIETAPDECLGQKAGGILFGDGIQPQSAQNNVFSNNNLTTAEGESSADIIFQSKQLLDNAGGIESVAQGYKFEQIDINSTATGEVKIEGFSSNFGPYLDCVTRNGKENCEQIPCGGKLNQKPEDCEIKIIDEEQKDIQDDYQDVKEQQQVEVDDYDSSETEQQDEDGEYVEDKQEEKIDSDQYYFDVIQYQDDEEEKSGFSIWIIAALSLTILSIVSIVVIVLLVKRKLRGGNTTEESVAVSYHPQIQRV